jgi:hypothetical protein
MCVSNEEWIKIKTDLIMILKWCRIGTYHVISQQYVRKKTYVQLKKMSIFYFCFIEDEATQIHFSRLRHTSTVYMPNP